MNLVRILAMDTNVDDSRKHPKRKSGPKTALGKSRTRFNAVKDGVYSTQRLLPGEDEAEYKRMSADLFEENKPATVMERTLVELMVGNKWRIRRIDRAEAAYFAEIRKSLLARTLQYMSGREFEIAKTIIDDKELLRAGARARDGWRLEHVLAGYGRVKFDDDAEKEAPLSKEETDALLKSVVQKLEEADDLDKVLLEGMASPDKTLGYTTLEAARRAETRDLTRNYGILLQLQERRRTMEATAPVRETGLTGIAPQN